MESKDTIFPKVNGTANFFGFKTIDGTFIVLIMDKNEPTAKQTANAKNR